MTVQKNHQRNRAPPSVGCKGFRTEFYCKVSAECDDDIMYKALKIVLLEGHTSTSYLQRNLKISYNRAAELLETMEARKIVSKFYGNGTREVLIKRKTTRRRKYSGE